MFINCLPFRCTWCSNPMDIDEFCGSSQTYPANPEHFHQDSYCSVTSNVLLALGLPNVGCPTFNKSRAWYLQNLYDRDPKIWCRFFGSLPAELFHGGISPRSRCAWIAGWTYGTSRASAIFLQVFMGKLCRKWPEEVASSSGPMYSMILGAANGIWLGFVTLPKKENPWKNSFHVFMGRPSSFYYPTWSST